MHRSAARQAINEPHGAVGPQIKPFRKELAYEIAKLRQCIVVRTSQGSSTDRSGSLGHGSLLKCRREIFAAYHL